MADAPYELNTLTFVLAVIPHEHVTNFMAQLPQSYEVGSPNHKRNLGASYFSEQVDDKLSNVRCKLIINP